MPTEELTASDVYFDTPERAERLQLISHLLNNAEDVPYLRAPSGAGKTRAVAHLAASFGDTYQLVWIDTSVMRELSEAVCAELGLNVAELDWPDEVLAQVGETPILVIVDDADALDLASIGDLFELHERGVRLLFLGNGGLAQLQGDWDLQFVDLPAFTEAQSLAFIREQPGGDAVTEAMAVGLHRAAEGLPGHLLNALTAMPSAAPTTRPSPPGKPIPWPWVLGIGVAAVLLGATLYFQDDINALFEEQAPPVDEALPVIPPTASSPVVAVPDESVAVPEEPEAAPIDESWPKPELGTKLAPKPEPGISESDPVMDLLEAAQALPTDVEPPVVDEPVAPGDQVVNPPATKAEPEGEAGGADDMLDAVIEEAIAAAAQNPKTESQPPEVTEVVAPPPSVPESTEASVPPESAAESEQESKPLPKPVLPPPEPPKPVAKTPPKPAPVRLAEGHDIVWLRAQAPSSYTLQLVGARDRAAIARFIKRHKLKPPYAVYQRDLNGAPWYSLIQGVFDDRDAAVAARARLPGKLSQGGVWPRTFASIQEQLQ